MKLDSRIKRFSGNYFRFFLSIDDIIDLDNCVIQSVDDGEIVEQAALFTDSPIVYPYIPYSKRYKIGCDDLEELDDIICSYLFLNPTIDHYGLNKMADFISRYHLHYINNEEPSIDFDDLLAACVELRDKYPTEDIPITETDKVVLYQRGSLLSTGVRRNFSNYSRMLRSKLLWEDLIHNSAIFTIKNEEPMKIISRPMVMRSSEKLVSNGEISRPIRSSFIYEKYIKDKTKKLLIKAGKHRHVHSRSFDKWEQFIELDTDNMTMREITEKLSISNSTTLEYLELKQKYIR